MIECFLAVGSFAVVGASSNRDKYGNKVLRCYAQHDHPVVGVNPRADEIEGLPCYASLVDVPGPARAVSIVAPPAFAQQIVNDAVASSVRHLWFQPGSEDAVAIADAQARGIEVIAGGPCLLVALGYRDD
ncbi:MAG: putative CoA-binding protein [Planctomycetota bacterium]|jgi:predicted CoA-binding protein